MELQWINNVQRQGSQKMMRLSDKVRRIWHSLMILFIIISITSPVRAQEDILAAQGSVIHEADQLPPHLQQQLQEHMNQLEQTEEQIRTEDVEAVDIDVDLPRYSENRPGSSQRNMDLRDRDMDIEGEDIKRTPGEMYSERDIQRAIERLERQRDKRISNGASSADIDSIDKEIRTKRLQLHMTERDRINRRSRTRSVIDSERNKARMDRSRGRETSKETYGSREEMEQAKEKKFLDMIRGRMESWLEKINRATQLSVLSTEEADKLKREIDEYYEMELRLINSRLSIGEDFKQAGKIKTKEARRKFLDQAREKREKRRIEDNKVREKVIQLRGHFQEIVSQLTGEHNEL